MKRYSKESEKIILSILDQLRGKSIDEMVHDLNARGLSNANGNPWTSGSVDYFIKTRQSQIELKLKHRTVDAIPRLIAEALLTEPTLSDKQRVNMLQAYLNS